MCCRRTDQVSNLLMLCIYSWLTSVTFKEIVHSHLVVLLTLRGLQISLYRILLLVFFVT
ncbi:hypothetical protein BCV71DRAFT_257826 [Rhizopus microsporus]|uniref:Uncharacterized protein n=1 Tax=Rhizopus microsporus TaxID=58291 RepID=A0A1X0RRL0_RHIZD|nr:hypothetical protein BCV71DRAFT_257826 [Rhizopus microsporus]